MIDAHIEQRGLKLPVEPAARARLPDPLCLNEPVRRLDLRAENIGATMHYPLVYRHPYYARQFGYAPGLCPIAEAVEARLVTLPLFPAMTAEDQDDVLRALDKVCGHYAR